MSRTISKQKASSKKLAELEEDLSQPIDFWHLAKPKVMLLVIFSAWAGMVIAPSDMHPLLQLINLLGIALGSGASGMINMYYDADIDAVMTRTKKRPIPQGKIKPQDALHIGIILSIIGVVIVATASNYYAAALLAFTIFFYNVIYTMWLKRLTPQNIVIGGAAGAFPPIIGWLAVTGQIGYPSIVIFLLIFLWTPPHFWALALVKEEDYRKANIPMLPVVKGEKHTKQQIFIYTIILLVASYLPLLFTSYLYGVIVTVANLIYLRKTIKLWRSKGIEDAMNTFVFSIFYMFILLLAIVVAHFIG